MAIVTGAKKGIEIALSNVKNKKASNSSNTQSKSLTSSAYDIYSQAIAKQNDLLLQQQEQMRKQRENQLNSTVNANNLAAEKSMNEAYILKMQAERDMPQKLRAYGISGGAAESTVNDLNNSYMNSRAEIDAQRLQANAQAKMAYDDGISSDWQNYLSALLKLQSNIPTQTKSSGAKTAVTSQESASDATVSQPVLPNTQNSDTVALNAALISKYLAMGLTIQEINKILKFGGNK